jgi:hypothetical protein
MPWFVSDETYERKVRDPESGEIGTVTMRPLAAGDRLRSIDLARMSAAAGLDLENLEDGDEVELQVPMGRCTLLAVEAAVVAWSLPQPPTPDTIRALKPNVLEQIFSHVAIGAVEEPEDDAGPLDEQSEPSEHSSDELVEVHS